MYAGPNDLDGSPISFISLVTLFLYVFQARFAQENDIDLEASSSDAVIMTNELDPSLLPNSHWEIEGRLDQNEADGDHLYDTSWHRNHIAHRLRSRPTGSPLNVRFAVGLEILLVGLFSSMAGVLNEQLIGLFIGLL